MMCPAPALTTDAKNEIAQGTSDALRRKTNAVVEALERAYGSPRHGNLDDPLDELIYIKLSQQTNAAKFGRAFLELKRRFGDWGGLLQASEAELAEAIRPLGFHRQRAGQLKAMLQQIYADRGALDLGWLRELPATQAIAYLASLPGVGIKSAYCVAMYSLGADVLPVDTHVERVSSRLGLVSTRLALRSRQGDNLGIHDALERLIHPAERYSFHVNCVAHGRVVCTTKRPKCSQCVVNAYCEYYSQAGDLQNGSAAQVLAEPETSAGDAAEEG